MEAVLDAVERTPEARTKRGACARAAGFPPSSTATRKAARPIAVDPKMLARILRTEQGANTLIALNLPGAGDARVLVKEYQLDPVTHELLHADFYRVAMDKVIRVQVTVVAHGEPKGVKQQGGVLDIVHRQIEIECLPADIPNHIEVDVTEMMVGQSIRVQGHRDQPEVEGAQRSRNDAPARHHSEGRRGAGAADAAAAGAAAAPAEPEVIKKGKKDEEGAEAAAAPAAGKKEKK